ncbi:hypothetical protein LC048_10510 [Mesobacillus subterraneus]|uniref:hypothetical protein n=1 Tax=Mesobacillus subterraneus TaxID=285983 RepID=UPI001CFC5AF4|nr:hypothetical protein [Mesobacillus subterraneus]WLR57247.1 hypothetical protein LC048_10510 [Mesobacillus subterraneus]
MTKKFVYYLLTIVFFVGYVFLFDYFFKYIEMMFVPYGLLIFILQIGFSLVNLFPASIITTRKIVEIIRR